MSDDYDLGTYVRDPVTTRSDTARAWFNRGLVWCYAFNHEEAIACFERALADDPDCALAHWGIAYAIGPNYNKPWAAFDEADKRRSMERAWTEVAAATACAAGAAPVEQALVAALALRYPADVLASDFAVRARRLCRRYARSSCRTPCRPRRLRLVRRRADEPHALATLGRSDRSAGAERQYAGGQAGPRDRLSPTSTAPAPIPACCTCSST